MTKIRQSVKSKILKAKGKARARSPTNDDSDNEVEFVETPNVDEPPAKRPRLAPLSIPHRIEMSSPISMSNSPSPGPTTTSSIESTHNLFLLSAHSSRSSTPPRSSGPSSSTLSPVHGHPFSIPGKAWPANMYVKDMVKGFVRMDTLKKTRQGRFDERFREVYGQDPPKSNTYHDQVRKWNLASGATRDTVLAAGRTRDGEWSRFACLSPLKKKL